MIMEGYHFRSQCIYNTSNILQWSYSNAFVFHYVSSVAKGKGKGLVKDVLKGPEVCKDPVKLTSYAVGVNIYKQGDDPPLKSKEEYPAW